MFIKYTRDFTVTKYAHIFIDKPSPPKGPLEISGMTETSCTIKWHAPENDGGTPILDYAVERKETNKKAWHKVFLLIAHY